MKLYEKTTFLARASLKFSKFGMNVNAMGMYMTVTIDYAVSLVGERVNQAVANLQRGFSVGYDDNCLISADFAEVFLD